VATADTDTGGSSRSIAGAIVSRTVDDPGTGRPALDCAIRPGHDHRTFTDRRVPGTKHQVAVEHGDERAPRRPDFYQALAASCGRGAPVCGAPQPGFLPQLPL